MGSKGSETQIATRNPGAGIGAMPDGSRFAPNGLDKSSDQNAALRAVGAPTGEERPGRVLYEEEEEE